MAKVRRRSGLGALLVVGGFGAVAWLAAAAETHERLVPMGGFLVGLSTKGASSFRLRLVHDEQDGGKQPSGGPPVAVSAPAPSTPFVDDDVELKDAPWEPFEDKDGAKGIHSPLLGNLVVTRRGEVLLRGVKGDELVRSAPLKASGSTARELLLIGGSSGKVELFGGGSAPPNAKTLLRTGTVTPLVCNTATWVPYYYSTDGYSALGAVGVDEHSGPSMKVSYTLEGNNVKWTWDQEGPFDLYLMPAQTLEEGTRSLYQLTGRPAVLPRYAFGFGASRWGWESRAYIEDVLHHFRDGRFPIDYVIMDFEWFVTETDYPFKPPGKDSYHDFGYNPALFDQPAAQLKKYRDEFKVRMGGIRKPRIGNTAILNEIRPKGWILPNGEPAGRYPAEGHYADDRSLDFAKPEVRDWYAAQHEHYIEDGVSFWWNDEGETNYFAYYWWNIAERSALHAKAPTKRFFSLNRAFSPGMARLGAAVWTGDIEASWAQLQNTPGMMLNWVLSGAPYVACDIGGFLGQTAPELLARWFQVGVFMPIMRVHSEISAKPHFPWAFGDAPADAMRKALELRYRLAAYHYSLAHRLYSTYEGWIRPLSIAFPNDDKVHDLTSQWMDGDIMVAPVLRQDSQRDIYLPKGTDWYAFAADPATTRSLVISGGQRLNGRGRLPEVPAFVRPGTIVPLAPILQSLEDLPGGPLEVQVYAGADGRFELVEDDGESLDYTSGEVRRVTFTWSDDSRKLRWNVSGANGAPGAKAFVKLRVKVFEKATGSILFSDAKEIAHGGVVDAKALSNYVV